MTELELHKFIEENQIEIDWQSDELVVWIPFHHIEKFTQILGYNYLCEGGLEVTLCYDCIAFDLVNICENFDIEPNNILSKQED